MNVSSLLDPIKMEHLPRDFVSDLEVCASLIQINQFEY